MSDDKEYPEPVKNDCGGYYCSEEHGHIDCVKHEHSCECGGKSMFGLLGHDCGAPGCFREMCEAPVELNNDWWQVEGKGAITGYSLREQRMYHKHSCGCWSRARDGSTNSIDA